MNDPTPVNRFWPLLLAIYIASVIICGMLTSISFAAGKMFVPILVGAGLLRLAKSPKAIRNIYILILLIVAVFLVQDYSDARKEIISSISYGCVNYNPAVDQSVSSDQQEADYCGCMGQQLANFFMFRSVEDRLFSTSVDLTADSISHDTEMTSKMASAQQICSSLVLG